MPLILYPTHLHGGEGVRGGVGRGRISLPNLLLLFAVYVVYVEGLRLEIENNQKKHPHTTKPHGVSLPQWRQGDKRGEAQGRSMGRGGGRKHNPMWQVYKVFPGKVLAVITLCPEVFL